MQQSTALGQIPRSIERISCYEKFLCCAIALSCYCR